MIMLEHSFKLMSLVKVNFYPKPKKAIIQITSKIHNIMEIINVIYLH